jgi:hypothetical protein
MTNFRTTGSTTKDRRRSARSLSREGTPVGRLYRSRMLPAGYITTQSVSVRECHPHQAPRGPYAGRRWARPATWSGLATGEGMRRRTGRTLPRSSIPSGSRVTARWFVTISRVASLFAPTSGSQPVAFAASPLVPSNYPTALSFGRKGWSITSISIKCDFRIALPSTCGVRSNSLREPWSMRTGGGASAPRANGYAALVRGHGKVA